MYKFLLILLLVLGFDRDSTAEEFRLLKLDDRFVKWGAPTWGTGAEITYSFVQRERHFADAINCKSLVPLEALLERSGISKLDFKLSVRRAFDRWEKAADLRFSFVDDPSGADILIGAQANGRGIAYANVWPDPGARAPLARITLAVFCLNPEVPWETDFDGDEQTFDIERVATHEIGHTIGLDHPGPSGQLMGFRYSEADDGLKFGDRDGAMRLYGRPSTSQRQGSQPGPLVSTR